jgi:dolichol-phosphate mannosyltransferase
VSGRPAGAEEKAGIELTGTGGHEPAIGRVAVIMPTYNERDNIESTVGRVRQAVPTVDVLVVDDNSPDGTGEIADKLAAGDPQVHVLHRAGKAGLGAAYIAGFRWALERGYGAVVEMDADGSHGNIYVRLLLGLRLKDATGGYRAYRASTLERIGLDQVESQGYCFQVDLARRAVGAGLAVTEVPITFVERVHGSSKMSRAIVAEAFWRVAVWGLTGQRRPG